jgi:Protein of unknown function (DUF2490)
MLFCVACISLPLAAQSSPAGLQGTDFQTWDELDALTRLSSHLDVTWIARARLSSELPNPTHYVFGTDRNFSVGKGLVLTPFYYYDTYRTASGVSGHRHVPIFAVRSIFMRGRLTLSDRNRFGGRFDTNAEPSWFYRNRPSIEYRIGVPREGHRFSYGMRFFVSRSTEAGPETELQPVDVKRSVNASQPTFTTSAKITRPAVSLRMLIRSRS